MTRHHSDLRSVLEALAWMCDRGSSVDALARVLGERELRVAITLAVLTDVGLVRYSRGSLPEARITPLGIASLTATPRPIVLHGVLDRLSVTDDVVDASLMGTDGATRITARMDMDDVRVIAAVACRQVKVTIELVESGGARRGRMQSIDPTLLSSLFEQELYAAGMQTTSAELRGMIQHNPEILPALRRVNDLVRLHIPVGNARLTVTVDDEPGDALIVTVPADLPFEVGVAAYDAIVEAKLDLAEGLYQKAATRLLAEVLATIYVELGWTPCAAAAEVRRTHDLR